MGSPARAEDRICVIEIEGTRRMTREAFLFELRVKEGDVFDPMALRREFRRLWDRSLFSDLELQLRRRPECVDLRFLVEERPTIAGIEYDQVKAVTRQQIEDAYAERGFSLQPGGPVDRKQLRRAEQIIEQTLGMKGFLGAEVEAVVEFVTEGSRKVHFQIAPGAKTRIRKINFVGNEVYSGRRLRGALELTRQHRWWWPFGRKTLYHELKYQQDIQNVYDLYRNHGYLDVDIKPPVVEVREVGREKAQAKAEKKLAKKWKKYEKTRAEAERKGGVPPAPPPSVASAKYKRWVLLRVRVEEGQPYELGDLTIEGNHVLETEQVRRRIPLRAGVRLNEALLEAGLERVRREYGRRGYIYADVGRRIVKRAEGQVADVVVAIDEDQQYYVDRIEFEGNSLTQDSVLRREMRVTEGELMNRDKLDLSLFKLSQLGFWRPQEEAILEPVPDEDRVKVRIKGQEESRNEIQVGGGFSELEGAFFAGSFRTTNFLGRGETVGVSATVGGRSNRYVLSFVEPWFLGKPYLLGFNIFRREVDFGRFQSTSGIDRLQQLAEGGTITLGRRFGNFLDARLGYSFQRVEADTADLSGVATSTTRVASLTPMLIYNRVNHPFRPNRGYRFQASVEVAHSGLGGDNSYFKPIVDATWYKPLFSGTYLGVHGRLGWVEAFGDAEKLDPNLIDGVPRFERFFLGGDLIGPRNYETRSIGPTRWRVFLDEDGNPVLDGDRPFEVFVGGSKEVLLQLEYAIPLGQPAVVVLYYDAGGTFDNGVDIEFDDLRMSAGVEMRLFLPVFQAPIRLIYGFPFNDQDHDQTNRFQFSIGTSF
jgi:outer membrane protein insertion porin family